MAPKLKMKRPSAFAKQHTADAKAKDKPVKAMKSGAPTPPSNSNENEDFCSLENHTYHTVGLVTRFSTEKEKASVLRSVSYKAYYRNHSSWNLMCC